MKTFKSLSFSDKIATIALLSIVLFVSVFWVIENVEYRLSEYCHFRRKKNTIAKIEYYRQFSAGIVCYYKYMYNNSKYVIASSNVFRDELNLKCLENNQSDNPNTCKGDTVEIVYDSLDYENSYIVGRSEIPTPDESYRPLFEWYERNFVNEKEWCVCESEGKSSL